MEVLETVNKAAMEIPTFQIVVTLNRASRAGSPLGSHPGRPFFERPTCPSLHFWLSPPARSASVQAVSIVVSRRKPCG